VARPWQDTTTILGQFGPNPTRARRAYAAFVAQGFPQGHRPELQGGGLLRSLRGWQAVTALRRGREAYRGDERVLGSTAFVAALQRAATPTPAAPPAPTVATLCAHVCAAVGRTPAQLAGGGRTPPAVVARAGIAFLWVEVLGHPGRPLAPQLGVQPAAVPKAARRGAATTRQWRQVPARLQES